MQEFLFAQLMCIEERVELSGKQCRLETDFIVILTGLNSSAYILSFYLGHAIFQSHCQLYYTKEAKRWPGTFITTVSDICTIVACQKRCLY